MATIFDDFGAPSFGLNDVKIAVWNGDGTYGTAVDVPAVQLMRPTIKVVSAQLEGDDQIVATGSRGIGTELVLRFGSLNINAMAVMVGVAKTGSGSGSTEQDGLILTGGMRFPYFGICGKALSEELAGDTHIFLPKVRIMSDFVLGEMEYGKFGVTEISVYGVSDGLFGMYNVIEHETAAEIALPPAGLSYA